MIKFLLSDQTLSSTESPDNTKIIEDPNFRRIGNYQYNIRFCLGEGSYGKVFHGKDIKNNSEVAIKQIETKFIEQHDKYIKQQIVSEIDILKKFNHPNIVRFIDLIEANNSIYIITEFCKDGDLKEFLNHRKIQEQDAFNILKDIVQGFKELNKQGIIHRDLKPANILINNGIYKIADFGFAKAVANVTSTYMLRSLVGSPYYMAPQLLATQQYCYKCDIWSLAVIYYEMVIGDLPWLASDPSSLLKKILQIPIINKLKNAKISSFSSYFIERCLTVDETKRPSWEEVFQMISSSPLYKQIQSNSPPLQQITTEDPYPRQIQSIDEPDGNLQTKSQLEPPSEETLNLIQQIIESLQHRRQELVFKHYLTCEILINRDDIRSYQIEEVSILKFLVILTRLITNASQLQIMKVRDQEKKSPEYFQISKNLNTMKQLILQEDDYYQQFQSDLKELLQNEKILDDLKKEDDLKNVIDLENLILKEQSQVKSCEQILLKVAQQILKGFQVNLENLTNQVFKQLKQQNQIENDERKFQILILLEQIMNLMMVLNNDIEDNMIHFEELYNSSSTKTKKEVYITIISTNINALLIN